MTTLLCTAQVSALPNDKLDEQKSYTAGYAQVLLPDGSDLERRVKWAKDHLSECYRVEPDDLVWECRPPEPFDGVSVYDWEGPS